MQQKYIFKKMNCQFCLTKKDLLQPTEEQKGIINQLFNINLNNDELICMHCNSALLCFHKFRQNSIISRKILEQKDNFDTGEVFDDSIKLAFVTILTWLNDVKMIMDTFELKTESNELEVKDESLCQISWTPESENNHNMDSYNSIIEEKPFTEYFQETLKGQRRPYKCPKCDKYFTKGELQFHMNVHMSLKPFNCVVNNCKSRFSSPRIMRVHARRIHQIKIKAERPPYKRRKAQDERYIELNDKMTMEKYDKSKIDVICSVCGKEVRKKHFSTHFQTHATSNDLSCPYKHQGCTDIFRMRYHLTSHIQKIHDPSYIPELRPADRICELCGKCFTKATIKYHMNVHFNLTPYACQFPGCSESFKDPTLLRQHNRTVHLKIKIFRCRYCPKKIYSQEEYDQHKTENCGVKSLACHICGKFINKMNLKCHLAIHKGERNFICPEEGCGKSFLLKNKLQQHSKSHSTECNFICNICSAAFKCKQSLKSHMSKKHLKENCS